MTVVQSLTLLASSNARWTTTQEKTIARDYPFTDLDLETPDQFVVRTYLQFLWLPESIMPINLLVPSLHRVQDASPQSPDSPHPLHALLDPLLLSVRSVVAKYHTDLPEILVQDGGGGGLEECMMWYALGYEMSEVGGDTTSTNNEDAIMLEEKLRNDWLERLERREVQLQVLLYLLKLSLPGPCTPLAPVKIPANDVVPSTKKKRQKERAKVIIPSAQERLESFMDKLSMWQLVINVNDANKPADRDERDWMQAFCENVVERQFKAILPDLCALLRRKLFPHSPFADEDNDTGTRSSPGSQVAGPARPRPNRKLTRSSTSTSVFQSKGRPSPKPIQRSSSILPHTTASDTRSRSRSLSVSLAQDASARRSNSSSGTSSSLKRALSREVSMSRGFKPRAQQSQASQPNNSSTKVPARPKKEAKKEDKGSQGVTLVAATPTKPKIREGWRNSRQTSSQSQSRAFSPDLEVGMDDDDGDELGDADNEGLTDVKDEDEELWLPNSSPDVLLLGGRKRAASSSSSSRGLSDPAEEGGMDTPAKKRLRR
ncbi:hypothetical protein HD554DRAFT_2132718 [Boletus coccyginus]|nr:hypothetical protein HD554DRAFT_2132718 [Boletus coccyginus]